MSALSASVRYGSTGSTRSSRTNWGRRSEGRRSRSMPCRSAARSQLGEPLVIRRVARDLDVDVGLSAMNWVIALSNGLAKALPGCSPGPTGSGRPCRSWSTCGCRLGRTLGGGGAGVGEVAAVAPAAGACVAAAAGAVVGCSGALVGSAGAAVGWAGAAVGCVWPGLCRGAAHATGSANTAIRTRYSSVRFMCFLLGRFGVKVCAHTWLASIVSLAAIASPSFCEPNLPDLRSLSGLCAPEALL